MRTRTRQPNAKRPATTERRPDNDAWVDQVSGPAPRSSARPSGTALTRSTRDNDAWVDLVADEVQALLREHGLDFELLIMFDPICEQLHAVGYDGAPARFFQSLETDPASSEEAGQPEAKPSAA